MEDIRGKIQKLTDSYRAQLELYKRIRAVGSQEQDLISQGRFARLLEVLKEKGGLLKEAGRYEAQIKEGQAYLAGRFQLSEFSLSQLQTAAAAECQNDVEALQAVIGELVPVLEVLEEQERSNEALLSSYLEQTRDPNAKRLSEKRAGRAYGKRKRS